MKRTSSTLVGSTVLCLIALGLCVYLSVLSLTSTVAMGCGSGSGCAEVLGSRWSSIGPVPVSVFGAVAYGLVLLGLINRWLRGRPGKLGDFVLILSIPAILLAVAWYVGLQLFVIKAMCPFCLASHIAGLFLVVFLFVLLAQGRRSRIAMPSSLGMLVAAGLITANVILPAQTETVRATNPFADQDGDTWLDDARYVSMFGGELQFVLQDVPYIGDPNAEHVVAVLFDYACPHCKTLHAVLNEAIEQDTSRFVLVPLPISIHENINPYIASDDERFERSYLLAIYAMAAGSIDRDKYKAYDRWLFSSDGAREIPRSANAAINKAVELFEGNVFKDQLGANSEQYDAMLRRNIELLRLLPEDQRFIPVTTTPGAPEHLTTRFDDINVLYELLDAAKASQ